MQPTDPRIIIRWQGPMAPVEATLVHPTDSPYQDDHRDLDPCGTIGEAKVQALEAFGLTFAGSWSVEREG